MKFLASDQSDRRIKLFSNNLNDQEELIDNSIWKYPFNSEKFIRPTDAKRVDNGDAISVIIATHGKIATVPYNFESDIITARTHKSCHSVEKMPDGNLISVSSKDNCITIHYDKKRTQNGVVFETHKDFELRFGHGVVFDKKRNCVWALGVNLQQYEYIGGENPKLLLIETYKTPAISGHDLFPSTTDRLLLTVGKGIYEFDIPTKSFIEISSLRKVKSAVRDIESGDIFITEPKLIFGYARWQTHTILNLTSNQKYKRKGGRFYKVRLWQKNEFSY